MDWDVIVVGAGAAGLLAATRAAERGKRTLLLEKNRKPAVKILISGGTRCNLTHNTDSRGIVAAYGRQGRFLHSALAALSPQVVVALVEAEGVPTKVEETGKIFPVSDRALDVANALVHRLRRSGAELSLEEPLLQMRRIKAEQLGGGFELITNRRTLTAEKVIVTTGGLSYPGSGTTGDGYAWAADMGHTIVPTRPALVPVTTSAQWVQPLQGVTMPDTVVRVIDGAQKDPAAKPAVLDERRGSLLFTHFGLSGPVILDISRAISGHPRPQSLSLVCDLLPVQTERALDELLRTQAAAAGKRHVISVLPEQLPRRLVETLAAVAELPLDRKAAELSKTERARLVAAIKHLTIPVSGTRGYKKAEVTAGGVSLDEVDSRTMQSKLVPNLYFAGEVLDLDGPIGGFNFQAAFSTGWLAGQSV